MHVLLLLVGTVSTDALVFLSNADQDRAIVRCLGLLSNLLADVPFFVLEMGLILEGRANAAIIASAMLNLLSIAFKLMRNWIILVLARNRWWRFRHVRTCTRPVCRNFRAEDFFSLPLTMGFWLLAIFYAAVLARLPLYTLQLSPMLSDNAEPWERTVAQAYYAVLVLFMVNTVVNFWSWTSYLANPRFSHSWMLENPLLTAFIGVLGLVDGARRRHCTWPRPRPPLPLPLTQQRRRLPQAPCSTR